MKKRKPISDNNRPLNLFKGKIKDPETIGKAPLA